MKNKNQSKNIVHAKDKINLLLSCGGNYSTRQICNIINTNEPTIRKAISSLREEGVLIIATEKKGYRLASTPDEVYKQIELMEKHINSMQKVANKMKQKIAMIEQNDKSL